ncbi:MAG: hypothetical protein ABEI98_01045 [Halorhabdus sp.]
MSSDARPTSGELVRELAGTLRSLRQELRETDRRGDGLDRLVRFTSEVTIPATILVLETNIRTLRLLQRSMRIARTDETQDQSVDESELGSTVVSRIDRALREAQTTIENAPVDERARDLLVEARELNRQLEDRLDTSDGGEPTASVDVESELASLKDEYGEDADDDSNGT